MIEIMLMQKFCQQSVKTYGPLELHYNVEETAIVCCRVYMGGTRNDMYVACIANLFLALLNRIAILRGYAIPNFCVVRLRRRHHRRKRFVQTLSPLKFMDQLTSKFT